MRRPLACLMALSVPAIPAATAQDLLRLPVYGAVEAGMGFTLATATGAAALFATPAGMGVGTREVAVTVLRWSDGPPFTTGTLAATLPLGPGLPLGAGLSLRPTLGFVAGGFVRTTGTGTDGNALFDIETTLGAALGVSGGPLRAGVGFKGLRVSQQRDAVFRGLSIDVGVQAAFAAGDLVLGAVLRNAGPALSGPGSLRADLPTEVRAGASWRALSVRAADGGPPIARLRLAADLANTTTGDDTRQTFHTGAEVVGFDQFAGRIGRVTALGDTPDALSRWTFGLGYRQGRLHADAAVLPSPEGADPSVSFTLRTGF